MDPGDAQPVLHRLQRDDLQLEAILVTHHHPDHILFEGRPFAVLSGNTRVGVLTHEYT